MSQNSTEVLTLKLRNSVWAPFTQQSSTFSRMKAGGDRSPASTQGQPSSSAASAQEELPGRLPEREGLTLVVKGIQKIKNWGAHSLVSFTLEGSEVTTGAASHHILRCPCPTDRQGLRSQHPQGRLQPPALKKSELLSYCCESLRCAKQMVPRLSAEAEHQMASFGDTLK